MTTRWMGCRILLVEDEPLLRFSLTELRSGLGYVIDAVTDPDEGLVLFDLRRHTLVLTDYHLPQKSGAQLARAIRARAPRTPVILISGSAFGLGEEEARLFAAIIEKPFTIADAARVIEHVLDSLAR